jgi:hypothetical protein
MPIVIKCTNEEEAKTAFNLQQVFVGGTLDYRQAESAPELFAQAIIHSTQITNVFNIAGPFHAVYRGRTEKAIYVRD